MYTYCYYWGIVVKNSIMHLSMYCPIYHPTGKRWGFDCVWPINMPWIRGIWSIFMDNRGKSTVLWWGHLILVFAPGERQLISYRSNPPPLPVGWYLGQYIDRCIIETGIICPLNIYNDHTMLLQKFKRHWSRESHWQGSLEKALNDQWNVVFPIQNNYQSSPLFF